MLNFFVRKSLNVLPYAAASFSRLTSHSDSNAAIKIMRHETAISPCKMNKFKEVNLLWGFVLNIHYAKLQHLHLLAEMAEKLWKQMMTKLMVHSLD